MAQVIGTNVASLNAQRHLNSSQSALHTSLERLSSERCEMRPSDCSACQGAARKILTPFLMAFISPRQPG